MDRTIPPPPPSPSPPQQPQDSFSFSSQEQKQLYEAQLYTAAASTLILFSSGLLTFLKSQPFNTIPFSQRQITMLGSIGVIGGGTSFILGGLYGEKYQPIRSSNSQKGVDTMLLGSGGSLTLIGLSILFGRGRYVLIPLGAIGITASVTVGSLMLAADIK